MCFLTINHTPLPLEKKIPENKAGLKRNCTYVHALKHFSVMPAFIWQIVIRHSTMDVVMIRVLLAALVKTTGKEARSQGHAVPSNTKWWHNTNYVIV